MLCAVAHACLQLLVFLPQSLGCALLPSPQLPQQAPGSVELRRTALRPKRRAH